MRQRNDAEVRLKVTTDSKESEKGIENLNNKAKETPKHLDTIKNVGAKAFKATAVAVGITATALTGLVTKGIQSYADLEQNIGGIQTLFKDSSNEVIENAKKAYKTAGMSANEYMENVTSFSASLLQGLGGDTEKAAKYADMAIRDMSDNANKMGTDISLIQSAYQGFAKQNYTMLDNLKLGYGGTKTEMERLLSDAEKITGFHYDINNLNDVYNAIHVIQGGVDELNGGLGDVNKGLGITGTTAEEAEGTISGSISMLKASFDNFLNGSGSIDEVVESLIVVANNISDAIVKIAPNVVDGVVKLINNLVPQLSPLLQKLLPVVIQGAIDLIQGLVKALPSLIPVLMDGIVQALKGISAILPELIQGLITGFVLILNALCEQMPTLIPVLIDAILEIIPMLIENLPLFMTAGWKLMIALGEGLIKSVPSILSKLPAIVSSIIKYFQNMIDQMSSIGGNLVKGLWNGISNVKNWILDKIKGFGKSILNSIKGIFGVHSPSTEFAWIGKMNMIGLEEGMEDMKDEVHGTMEDTVGLDFLKNGSMNVSSSFENSLPNISNNQPIIVNVEANMDVNKFGQAFVNKIKTHSGGSKNSYNYGGGY